MARLCERPGCSDVAALSFGFDVDRLLVWLAPGDPDGDPLRAGALCLRHGDAMVVPRGWTLDDRREPTPRLFRPRTVDPAPAPRRRRATAATDPGEQLVLETVAEVAGPSASDDPDATAAIPWLPTGSIDDDLDGVLDARSPLLARAFRGTDRPR